MTSTPQRDLVRSARRPSRGFTLIEVMVAMMVIALIATIGVKGFRTVTKGSLREGSAHMSGAIRFLFDRASITGKYHRLVIDLNEGRYWAEVSDDRFYAPNQAESELRPAEARREGDGRRGRGAQATGKAAAALRQQLV